ncbi:hypothetical protein WAK64_01000 [Bacillus spongiae]|uniref:Uncharacterized protein n=1 Tax=Bacillus spongiae TaxID=2683610 RepID=A0ABU8H8K4_9BACI
MVKQKCKILLAVFILLGTGVPMLAFIGIGQGLGITASIARHHDENSLG